MYLTSALLTLFQLTPLLLGAARNIPLPFLQLLVPPQPLLPLILLAFNLQIFPCSFCLLPGKPETFESTADYV